MRIIFNGVKKAVVRTMDVRGSKEIAGQLLS